MKTKLFLLTLTSIILSYSSIAADLVVEEFGPPSSYPSITAAISAASSGDRIIVKNRAGNIPWVENITIDKSLTIMSGQEDTTFLIDGEIYVNPVQGGEVTIIGAYLYNNHDINAGGGSIPKRSMKVNVLGCYGSNVGANGSIIDLEHEGILATIVSCEMRTITISYGNLFGNKAKQISVMNITSQSSSVVDTCYIIGNYIYGANAGYSTDGQSDANFYYFGGGEFVVMKNNHIENINSRASNEYSYGVYFKAASGVPHKLYNNTIKVGTSSSSSTNKSQQNAIRTYGTDVELINNILICVGGSSRGYAIYDYVSTSTINAFFNYVEGGLYSVENNLQAVANATTPNTGNPAVVFTDIDLTRNDIGATGGPYPISNYFDSNYNLLYGSARVFFVQHDIYISQPNPFNIKAFSFDR